VLKECGCSELLERVTAVRVVVLEVEGVVVRRASMSKGASPFGGLV
jgi:hypothetical protein